MNNVKQIKTMFFLAAPLTFLWSCDNNDNGKAKAVHDPNQPIVLTSFEPDSGRIREMVLLDGSNFGSDVSAIKVFFNTAEAKVIGSTGTRILALAPRMPGDTCILSVQIGNQKKEYEHTFRYKVEASVTTLTGNGTPYPKIFDQGLDRCQLTPVYIGADNDYNIFVTDDYNNLVRINVQTNTLQVVATGNEGFNHRCAPYVNSLTGEMMMGSERSAGGSASTLDIFLILDSRDGWVPKQKNIRTWDANGCPMPEGWAGGGWYHNETHYQCLYCETDGMYYTRYVSGQMVRVDPATWDAKIIGMTPPGLTFGMAFHPINKTELWFGYDRADAPTGVEPANSLYMWDVTDERKDEESNRLLGLMKMTGDTPPMGGHRDGPLNQSQFNGIRMISFDADGNLFVGDNYNHCIRMVDTRTMMVSTIIGIPGQFEPFRDGQRESATFNHPSGVAVDPDGVIYVTDYGNNRVRRIAIE